MLKLNVSGMNCGACVKKITGAVQTLDEDAQVDVDLTAKQVSIEGLNIDSRFEKAIQALGYEVLPA